MGRNNPFNDKPKSTKETASAAPAEHNSPEPVDDREIPTVPCSMWTVAGYILLFALLGFTGYSLLEQKNLNDSMRVELAERAQIIDESENRVIQADSQIIAMDADLQGLRSTTNRLQRERTALQLEKQELIKARSDAAKEQQNLKDEMRSALESRDVTISELQGNLTLNILDRILFDSGQAVIKPEGEDVLKQIGGVLDQVPNRQIHVMGHTDNIPIHTSNYPSNWELSAARALAAVRFLVDNGGVDPKRIAAVAHGEFQPIANNATSEGRARNRRITIVVLPEVFKTPEKPVEEEQVAETEPVKTTAKISTEIPNVSIEGNKADQQPAEELPETKPEPPSEENVLHHLDPVSPPDSERQ